MHLVSCRILTSSGNFDLPPMTNMSDTGEVKTMYTVEGIYERMNEKKKTWSRRKWKINRDAVEEEGGK